eukprot:1982991-Rhodomonas_salina.1
MSITRGEELLVTESDRNGWSLGTKRSGGAEGWFPSAFAMRVDEWDRLLQREEASREDEELLRLYEQKQMKGYLSGLAKYLWTSERPLETSHSDVPTALALTIDTDFDAIGSSSRSVQLFDMQLREDISQALGVPESCVTTLFHQRGSVIVQMVLRKDSQADSPPRKSSDLAAQLKHQIEDPTSSFQNSALGGLVRGVEVHGPVAEPLVTVLSNLKDMDSGQKSAHLNKMKRAVERTRIDVQTLFQVLRQHFVAWLSVSSVTAPDLVVFHRRPEPRSAFKIWRLYAALRSRHVQKHAIAAKKHSIESPQRQHFHSWAAHVLDVPKLILVRRRPAIRTAFQDWATATSMAVARVSAIRGRQRATKWGVFLCWLQISKEQSNEQKVRVIRRSFSGWIAVTRGKQEIANYHRALASRKVQVWAMAQFSFAVAERVRLAGLERALAVVSKRLQLNLADFFDVWSRHTKQSLRLVLSSKRQFFLAWLDVKVHTHKLHRLDSALEQSQNHPTRRLVRGGTKGTPALIIMGAADQLLMDVFQSWKAEKNLTSSMDRCMQTRETALRWGTLQKLFYLWNSAVEKGILSREKLNGIISRRVLCIQACFFQAWVEHMKEAAEARERSGETSIHPEAVSIRLDVDFMAAIMDVKKRSSFEDQLREDVSSALKIPTNMVAILGHERGSVVSEIAIKGTEHGHDIRLSKGSKALAESFVMQANDQTSALHSTITGSYLVRAELHGPISISIVDAIERSRTLESETSLSAWKGLAAEM